MKPGQIHKIVFFLLFFLSFKLMAQETDTVFLQALLESKPEWFKDVLAHPGKNEVQILYTQINRDSQNRPSFRTFSYNMDAQHYFYPASTVKLAAVIFALEKINTLHVDGLNAYSTMLTDSSFSGQTRVDNDASAENGKPSVAHYIKKILLTSDNDAFNRLFEFIGREEINAKLKKYGLTHSRILNRLAIGDGGEAAKHTNPIRFYNGDQLIFQQPEQYDEKEYPLKLNHLLVGKGYLDDKDELVNAPYSFENKNVFSLADQQALMKRLMMPEAFPKAERFHLTANDYQLIYTYMSMLPPESRYPKYNVDEFWPTYAKMLYYGRDKQASIDPHIRIFNKYGDSYGFIIDNSYFVDFKNKVEFFLTAVVQSNEDGIYNDNQYEYETVCYPFMKHLGQALYEYELQRSKARQPKLDKYQMNYR